jgi:hypothetical protein
VFAIPSLISATSDIALTSRFSSIDGSTSVLPSELALRLLGPVVQLVIGAVLSIRPERVTRLWFSPRSQE